MPELTTVRVANGLGFGEGKISAEAQESKPGNEDLAAVVDEAVGSERILVPVSKDDTGEMLQDDGCGDGRNVGIVFNKERQFKRSLNRAKVFGGGATMAASTRIGLGEAQGRSVQDTIIDATADINRRGLDYGAHTDTHANGPNCGCGAIDRAPQIIKAASTFKDQIRGVIVGLGIETDGLDEVEAEYSAYAASIEGQEYSGRAVMKEILDQGKIVKQLTDEHLETRIILNTVEDYTVDQEYVRNQTGGRAQVFAVDVWRLKQLAERLYDSPALQQKAFLSELIYTLATAAVLTKGDLPVYTVTEANQYAVAV